MPISPSTPHYPLAILGPGALGLHFAAGLNEHFPVALIARDEAVAARLRAGVEVGERRIRFDAFAPDAAPTADWVIVLVKAGDTADAAQTAARLARRGVLSLQNGLVGDLLCAACPDLPCGQGITTAGAFRDGERVTPVARGETLLPPGFDALAQMLAEGGFPARVEPDIDAARLAKLLVNVAINLLAAIFRVRNGELLQPPHSIYLDALAREAWPVLAAGKSALLLAPTGSGKTLAAFLAAIDRLMFHADPPPLKGGARGGISQLKRTATSKRSATIANPSPDPSLRGRGDLR